MVSLTVELAATDVGFFSRYDEYAFFEWLEKLKFVIGRKGRGRTLYITVAVEDVDEDGLRELLALFHRYGVALKQLSVFDREEFAQWFRYDKAFWYDEVFG
jgi:hypothetical protein